MEKRLKYVSNSNGRIVYRPRIPANQRHLVETDKHGFIKPPIKLGTPSDTDAAILQAYITVKNSLESRLAAAQAGPDAENKTLRYIVGQYMESTKFKALSSKSQKDAKNLKRILTHPMQAAGHALTLGDISIKHITQPMANRLAEKRLRNYQEAGRKGTAQVNRELTFLHTATAWAMHMIDNLGIHANPFKTDKFKEHPRDRYVTDTDYQIQRKQAEHVADYLPIVFELTYLIASRGVETLDIKLSDIDPNPETGGIFIHRRKGSRDNIINWSPRLFAAYTAAKELHKKRKITAIDAPLIIGRHGQALRKSSLDTAMHRLKKRMESEKIGLGHIFWTLHDLKRKGISDAKDKTIAGHKSEAMRQRYQVKIDRHNPVR